MTWLWRYLSAAVTSPTTWLVRAFTVSGRERESLIQCVKMAIAAVAAWWFAGLALPQESFVAPYAAVFLMSVNAYRSVFNAVTQVAALLIGVLLAFGAARVVPHPLAALAMAVFVGMLIGRWHRLGASGPWVGVTALLMLTYGTAHHVPFLLARLGDSVLGAMVGVAVNVLILPPVHLRQPHRAVQDLGAETSMLMGAIAEGLRQQWGHDEALSWLHRARRLDHAVRRAEEAVGQGWESARVNLRWWLRFKRSRGTSPGAYERPIRTLRTVSKSLQQATETLLAAAEADEEEPVTGRRFDESLAAMLDSLGDVVSEYRAPLQRMSELEAFEKGLSDARDRHDSLSNEVRSGTFDGQDGQHARSAALLAVDRALRVLATDDEGTPD